MSIVNVKNLWVAYGSVQAVRGVSFEIPKGEIYGFIGPNGAGKTSTIKVLATLIAPKSGRVSVCGTDILSDPKKVRGKIGYVPDTFGVYDDLTVKEYLHFFAAAYAIERYNRKKLIDSVLGLTDLTAKLNARVDTLSRGMKQRLSLARVLLHDPELLLLDEPASGLDPRARVEIREFLKELQSMGKTILISSHILHELAQFCTSVGIIEAGQMITSGPIDELHSLLDIGRTIHIELAEPCPKLEQEIHRVAGVHGIRIDGVNLSLELREDVIEPEDLLQQILALGARVRSFHPQVLDMETVFLKLTKGRTA